MPQLSKPSSGCPSEDCNPPHRLLTPFSNFPSKTLPPPGTQTNDLDDEVTIFSVGQLVRVRRYQPQAELYTGRVVDVRHVVLFVGCSSRVYYVEIEGFPRSQVFSPILDQMCDIKFSLRAPTDVDLVVRQAKILRSCLVFAHLPSTRDKLGRPTAMIWTPALIIKKRSDASLEVRSMAGPTLDQTFVVNTILPYNHPTANACKRHGDKVYGNGERMRLMNEALEACSQGLHIPRTHPQSQ